jgi:hypothetical protein
MAINYKQLRGETVSQLPADGKHQARLESANLRDTKNGERIVTEWSDSRNVMWTSWNRFDTTGMEHTRELLLGLGVDLSTVTDDDSLDDQLHDATGREYMVRTRLWGERMDQVNTYVDGRADVVQTQMATNGETPDVPIDTGGLPQPTLDDKFGADAPF